MTKKRLIEREEQFAWIYRNDFPDWGRGRDDAMNLTKYFMIERRWTTASAPTDMPSIWNLKKYDAPGTTMNWAGDSHDAVFGDHRLGARRAGRGTEGQRRVSRPRASGCRTTCRNGRRRNFRSRSTRRGSPQARPCSTERARAATPAKRPARACRSPRSTPTTGASPPGTRSNAIAANKVVTDMGIERKGLVEETLDGYNPPFLDGIWVRAPYLHNGSVPTLRDLLTPAANRPKVFWRGYDVYDTDNVGFVSQGPEAERFGTRTETTLKSGDNRGHEFGVDLVEADKRSLLEYLKSL